jgi:hypothetical protein
MTSTSPTKGWMRAEPEAFNPAAGDGHWSRDI